MPVGWPGGHAGSCTQRRMQRERCRAASRPNAPKPMRPASITVRCVLDIDWPLMGCEARACRSMQPLAKQRLKDDESPCRYVRGG